MKDKRKGFIAKCSIHGVILAVIKDDYNILLEGKSILTLIERSSSGKFFSFLREAQSQTGTIGWELNFDLNNQYQTYHCGGLVSKQNDQLELTIFGSHENDSARVFYQDLIEINNAQTNQIRTLLKTDRSKVPNLNEFDELTQLNNEMANLQREMARKNRLLNKQNKELEELGALKNKFLGMAAHDLRNPLSAVQYYSEQIQNGNYTEGELADFSKKINLASSLMLHLVCDFLDVSKIESGNFELDVKEHNLLETVQAAIDSHFIQAEQKNIDIILENKSDKTTLNFDLFKITQVLNNLISNALKYSEPKTKIKVQISTVNDKAKIEVIDQGQGIPKDELEKVFQAYQTTSVKSTAGEKSTGLGLSIVTKVIEAHGGTYGVTSKVGVGSVFWIALPTNLALNKPAKAEQIIDGNSENLNDLTVLIADDDPLMISIHKKVLSSTGANVLTATNGQEAIEAFQLNSKIDVILMDANMPIKSGIEATKELRAMQNNTIIIGLTGVSDKNAQQELIDAGMNGVMSKPANKKTIITTIKNCLHGL